MDYLKKKKINKKINLKKCVELSNNQCQVCGSRNSVYAHHIIFKSEGGDDSLENLISLCFKCHRKAHDGYYIDKTFIYIRPIDFIITVLKILKDKRYKQVLLELNKK